MSKIVKNNTASPVAVSDVGVTIPASGQYVIPTVDYLLWAGSSDIVVLIGNATVTINDGSIDLNISDGTDLIKGLYPKTINVIPSAGTIFQNYDFATAVSRGLIPGHTRGTAWGYNPSVGNGFEPIWSKSDATYTFPSSASTLTINSSSSLDTLTGTGARVLVIEGLNGSMQAITEMINLNGTSNVTTTQQFKRVNFAYIAVAGSDQVNQGNIVIKHGAIDISYIAQGDSQSHAVRYSVPINKVCIITKGFFAYSKDSEGEAKVSIIAGGVKRMLLRITSSGEQTDYSTSFPYVVPGGIDIIAECKVPTGQPSATGCLEFLLVDV